MREIVIVPTWRRPGFLAAALRRLALADDGHQDFWLCVDRGHSPQVVDVARRFIADHPGRARAFTARHSYRGNSYNVLTAYKMALDCADVDLIHMVEEDVFVGRGYFDFHRQAHDLCDDAFAVSACRNQFYPHDPAPDFSAVYCWGGYQSLAVSFRPAQLAAVLPHLGNRYYRSPMAYCKAAFPRSFIPEGNAEQDGLLNRIVENQAGFVVYPHRPRAYHAGFSGYHREGLPLSGAPEELASQLLEMTSAQLNRAAYSYQDHRTVDLDASPLAVTKVVDWL